MAKRPLPSPEVLRQLLRYEPETGKLFWKERGVEWFKDGGNGRAANTSSWNKRCAGKEAFTALMLGYPSGAIFGMPVKAHRVAWAMMTGAWPTMDIDHINHVRSDNRWANLRQASRFENARNASLLHTNRSGTCGVCWDKRSNKWRAYIWSHGKTVTLGNFPNKSDAIATRMSAEKRIGFHKNHGMERP